MAKKQPQPAQALDWQGLVSQLHALGGFSAEVHDLVSRIIQALKTPPQALASAEECEPDDCTCDCLRQQREALVQALSHNIHLTARFTEGE